MISSSLALAEKEKKYIDDDNFAEIECSSSKIDFMVFLYIR